MSDLISRQTAIEHLKKRLYETELNSYAPFPYYAEMADNRVSVWLNEVPTIDPAENGGCWGCCCEKLGQWRTIDQWTPCSERLPDKEKKTYWICTDTGYQCECRWTNNVYGIGESDRWEWSIFDIPQYTKVSAWMPLPEPYKAERSADGGEEH